MKKTYVDVEVIVIAVSDVITASGNLTTERF